MQEHSPNRCSDTVAWPSNCDEIEAGKVVLQEL